MTKLNDSNIEIKGIIVEGVTMPKMDGTPGSALYEVPIQLSQVPSAIWSDIFINTWNRPPSFSTMHRPGIARIEGDTVYLDGTTLEEIEKVHKDTIVLCVDVANQEVENLYTRQKAQNETKIKKEQEHERNVKNMADKIQF